MNLELKLVRLLINKLINFVYLRDLQHKTLNQNIFSVHLIPIHHNNCKELFISVGITRHTI